MALLAPRMTVLRQKPSMCRCEGNACVLPAETCLAAFVGRESVIDGYPTPLRQQRKKLARILNDQLQLPESFGSNTFTCVEVCVLVHRLLSELLARHRLKKTSSPLDQDHSRKPPPRFRDHDRLDLIKGER